MTDRPPPPVESYLVEHWERGARRSAFAAGLYGAVILGPVFTLVTALMFAAATDTRPDFVAPLLFCVPAGAAFVLASRWLVGQVLKSRNPQGDTGASQAPPPIPNRESDSA